MPQNVEEEWRAVDVALGETAVGHEQGSSDSLHPGQRCFIASAAEHLLVKSCHKAWWWSHGAVASQLFLEEERSEMLFPRRVNEVK